MQNKYKDSGVDIEAGYESNELLKKFFYSTKKTGAISSLGGFSGLFQMPSGYKNPVLASGTDGVGTKLKLAFLMDKHDTIGIDLVAMCVNDIICCGASPLYFLDYIGIDKNIPKKIEQIVSGISKGCKLAQCSLIGGETAEMPGMYKENEYDLAGFAVGIVEKDEIIDGNNIKSGDALIGIPSSGIHSNGYSLVRKIFELDDSSKNLKTVSAYSDELSTTIGEALLTPTRIYVETLERIKHFNIKGIAHITGGGFHENIPRMVSNPEISIEYKDFEIPPIFKMIQKLGSIDEREMFGTFNMGIGLVLCVDKNEVEPIRNSINEETYVIGEII